jgi:hypothetical protein
MGILRAVDDRFRRNNLNRFVVIVDRDCRIVARDEPQDPAFAPYAGERLPDEIEVLVRSETARTRTHILSSGALMHIVPIRGTAHQLRALVFEELRVRAET